MRFDRIQVPLTSSAWDFVMAEIEKLSVGKALDKLRRADTPDPKSTQIDGKIGELDAEINRMRATRSRVERDQRAGAARDIAPEVTATRSGSKTILLWIVVAIFIAALIFIAAF